METITPKFSKYQKLIEASTWIVIIIVIFGVRFLPQDPLDNDQSYIIIGAIAAFALLYYLVIYKYFSRSKRIYLKEIADIVLIGILIHLLKDYGQYFFALYFLPIAAAALSLEFINALLIAVIASLFVIFEIFLNSFDLLPKQQEIYGGIWQIGLILLITVFCRFLAIQLKEEQSLKEEALARQKALEEESKREKEFMSLTSHQLFTPLSIIRGFSGMLNDEKLGKLTEKQKDAAEEIYTNVKRMVNLVSELLSISKIQSGTFEIKSKKTDLAKLLQNIKKEFLETQDAEISLELSVTNKEVELDEEKIRQVIYNLLDNAIKYSRNKKVTVELKQDEKNSIISVKDLGIGIPQEDWEKVFEPFYRGKNILELDNKGTGLGLYIARLIIEKHNGKIWLESKEGKGATFSFSVPNGKIE